MFDKLSDNEEYARKITDNGTLELCLDFVAKDPKTCTVPALNIINKIVDKDPRAIDR